MLQLHVAQGSEVLSGVQCFQQSGLLHGRVCDWLFERRASERFVCPLQFVACMLCSYVAVAVAGAFGLLLLKVV